MTYEDEYYEEEEVLWDDLSAEEKLDVIASYIQEEDAQGEQASENTLGNDLASLQQELGRDLTTNELEILIGNTEQTGEAPTTAYHRLRVSADSGLHPAASDLNSHDRAKWAAQVIEDEQAEQEQLAQAREAEEEALLGGAEAA